MTAITGPRATSRSSAIFIRIFLLVEDSFPEALPPQATPDLEQAFLTLTIDQRMQILYFLDWWGNRLMKNRPDIPLPCTFKTINGWQHYLQRFGFQTTHADFYGFPPLPTHMMSPKAILVAKKPVFGIKGA